MIRFFCRRRDSLFAGAVSHRKQPPPGDGYGILYFSANLICSFLDLPVILWRRFLLTMPDFSASVSGSAFAERGRRISKGSCCWIVFRFGDV